MSNQTAHRICPTKQSQMNQTASDNQLKHNPLTTHPQTQQAIRNLLRLIFRTLERSLDEVRKDIADGKATEALKAINDMDDKLLCFNEQ